MSKYIMLMYSPVDQDKDMSPADYQTLIEQYKAWSEEFGSTGKLLDGQKLKDDAGRVLEPAGLLRDGPFSETKEVIGGFFTIEASDYAEAAEIAKSCPHHRRGLRIEIRELD
jgi:hypothetical protein